MESRLDQAHMEPKNNNDRRSAMHCISGTDTAGGTPNDTPNSTQSVRGVPSACWEDACNITAGLAWLPWQDCCLHASRPGQLAGLDLSWQCCTQLVTASPGHCRTQLSIYYTTSKYAAASRYVGSKITTAAWTGVSTTANHPQSTNLRCV